jgi:hypothetical protein
MAQWKGRLTGPADVTAYRLVVSFDEALDLGDSGGAGPSTVPVRLIAVPDDEGRFSVDIPDTATFPLRVEVLSPAGLTAAKQTVDASDLSAPADLAVPADPKRALTQTSGVVRRSIRGIVVDVSAASDLAGSRVLVWGASKKGDKRVLLDTVADGKGRFFGESPDVELVSARASVGASPDEEIAVELSSGRVPDEIVLVIHPKGSAATSDASGDCGCDDSVPRAPDAIELTRAADTYSADIGGRCVDVTKPNRVLEEFDYYSVVRVTQPEIRGKTRPPRATIPAGALQAILVGLGDRQGNALTLDAGAVERAISSPSRLSGTTVRDIAMTTAIQRLGDDISRLATTHPRRRLTGARAIDWETSPLDYQATTIAVGHVLHFKQQWVADGYSLGDLLYSLPLAPCEKKEIAVIDWERRDVASRTEDVTEASRLAASLTRERDITDLVSAILAESMRGGSSSSTWGVGGGLGAAASYMGMGAVLGVSGGAGGADSSAWQDSSRTLSASALQQLRDRTMQAATELRTARRSVVSTVSQAEQARYETSVVHNHNHCHALTIQYFEVLRHFQVRQRLADVQECLFVPLEISPFDAAKAMRWRDPLERVVRRRELAGGFDALERIAADYAGLDWPDHRFADDVVTFLSGEITVTLNIVRPRGDGGGIGDEKAWAFLAPLFARAGVPLGDLSPDHPLDVVNRLFENATSILTSPGKIIEVVGDVLGFGSGSSSPPPPSPEELDAAFTAKIAHILAAVYVRALKLSVRTVDGAEIFDLGSEFTLLDEYRPGVPLRVSVRTTKAPAVARSSIDAVIVDGPVDGLPASSTAVLRSATFRYRTVRFEHLLVRDDAVDEGMDARALIPTLFLDDAERRDPKGSDRDVSNRLLAHLNDNVEAYHRAIWVQMDDARRYMLLDAVAAPDPNPEGRSRASVVDNRIIGVVGNSLVMPVAPGYHVDPTWTADPQNPGKLLDLYRPHTPLDPMRVSVPTRGVHAVAVMGACNSCERKDESRFWRFEESPCGDEPTPIAPIDTSSRRVDPGDMKASPLSQPIIAMQNAPAAPDPTGLAGALQLLSTPNVFRDMAGLTETQKSALASYQTALQTAKAFGEQATKLSLASLGQAMQQQQVSNDSDRIMSSIDRSADSGALSPKAAGELKSATIRKSMGGAAIPSDLEAVASAREQGLLSEADAQTLSRGILANAFGIDAGDAQPTVPPTSAAPAAIDAAPIKGTSADPRKAPVDLTFDYGGVHVKVRLAVKVLDEHLTPGEGDTDKGAEVVFFAHDKSKTRPGPAAWQYGVTLEYAVPADPSLEMPGVEDDEVKTLWEFGLIQNVDDLDDGFTYDGKKFYGAKVPGRSLDMSPAKGTPTPWNNVNAVTSFVFGTNAITVFDDPNFAAAETAAKKPLARATLKGTFDLWLVLRHKKKGDIVFLWSFRATVDRTFEPTGTGSGWTGSGNAAIVSAPARGSLGSPVLGGPTTHQTLNAAWTKP